MGTFTEDAVNIQYNNEFLRFSWVLSDSVTYKSGTVSAAIIFIGSESGNKYVLKTVPFTIKIENSLDFIVYDIEHKDWFTDIEYRLLNLEKGAIGEIDKKSLESALYDGITNTTTLDENDLIPLISESEDGHKSISKAVTLPTLAKEVANNIDIPGSEIAFENLTPVTNLTEDDEFLVGTAEGNKKIGCKALADGLKEMMNLEISTEEVSKIPFIRGFRIYMKDVPVNIVANSKSIVIGTFADFNITDKSLVYGLFGYSLSGKASGYTTYLNENIIFGRSAVYSSDVRETIRVSLIVKDTEIIDGAGEEAIPLFPGYDIKTFTKTYNISSGNMGIKLMDLSEAGILEEDVAFVVATCSTNPLIGTGWAGVGVIFENAVYFSASKAASSSLTVPITFSIIYRKEGSVLTGLPDLFTTTDIPMAETITAEDKLLLGTADGNKVVQNDLFIQYLRENGLFDLDGKGRPLLPGYEIVTKTVDVSIPNMASLDVKIFDLSDLGINPSDAIFAYGRPIDDGGSNDHYWSFSIIRDSVHLNRPALSAPSVRNGTFKVAVVYKKPVPFEPGLKTIEFEKTITVENKWGVLLGSLESFGISDPSLVTSLNVTNIDGSMVQLFPTIINEDELWVAAPNFSSKTTMSIKMTIIVKDYSSIGPSIVTEGIRVITREVSFKTFGSSQTTILTEADLDVNFDDIIAVDYKSNSLDGYTGYAVLNTVNRRIELITRANTSNGYIFTGTLSYFVKVPIVEQKLKPFTKDVEIVLNGTFGVDTGIIIDGSDAVGGFTMDTMHSYSAAPLTAGKWISNPTINNSNHIVISGLDTGQKGPCKIRIHIE